MDKKNIFYSLRADRTVYFSSYLSSFLELKKLNLQSTNQVNFVVMIADLQAMKTTQNRDLVDIHIKEGLACLLVTGLSAINKNINIFCQSAVTNHTHLAWALSYLSDENQDNLLSVADTLIYKTDKIAVDTDQIKNAILAIEIAEKFNNKYKTNIFNVPEILFSPLNKSSENIEVDSFFSITLLDTNEQIIEKIKNSNISDKQIYYDLENNLVISKLIDILSVLLNMTKIDIVTTYGGSGITNFKNTIIDATIAHINIIRNDAKRLLKDNFYLLNILKNGNQKANFTTNSAMERVKSIIGV